MALWNANCVVRHVSHLPSTAFCQGGSQRASPRWRMARMACWSACWRCLSCLRCWEWPIRKLWHAVHDHIGLFLCVASLLFPFPFRSPQLQHSRRQRAPSSLFPSFLLPSSWLAVVPAGFVSTQPCCHAKQDVASTTGGIWGIMGRRACVRSTKVLIDCTPDVSESRYFQEVRYVCTSWVLPPTYKSLQNEKEHDVLHSNTKTWL